MANVEKEMRTRPARFPLDTLDACIRDFLWRREPGGGMDVKADDIPAMCAAADSFEDAVWIACASKRRNGKMHTHQTKVRIDDRREFGYRIIEEYRIPSRFEPALFRVPGDFDAFHSTLWAIRPGGIGPLTVYDVATRVGAYLKLEPVNIYLHTGARLGWSALWGRRAIPRTGIVDVVPPELWPAPLRQLTADQAEDFLCTYRDALTKIRRNDDGSPWASLGDRLGEVLRTTP